MLCGVGVRQNILICVSIVYTKSAILIDIQKIFGQLYTKSLKLHFEVFNFCIVYRYLNIAK